MHRFLTVFFLFVLAATLAIGLQAQVVAQTRGAAPGTSAGCGCPKGNVCCLNCDGSTFCARSYAYCPECAAP